MDETDRDVVARMQSVYDAFLSGRPELVDEVLDADVTIWDSDQFDLVRGLAGLAALRRRRPPEGAAGTRPVSLAMSDPLVTRFGETAVLRHLLTVTFDDGGVTRVRNTSVWRRRGSDWFAVHNHEDVWR